MDNTETHSRTEPRPEKVAVVEEVRQRFEEASAVLVTEYRGVDVSGMATLRRSLNQAGGHYKVYKNTLVRRATSELGLELGDLLTGPTAIAFVPSDSGADPVTVAKALRAFGKEHPELVMKGGMLGDQLLTAEDARALAAVAPREELLARLAGDMIAPMARFAGLLAAVPRDFAGALQALVDKGGAAEAPAQPEAGQQASEETATGGEEDVAEEPPADAEGDATEES